MSLFIKQCKNFIATMKKVSKTKSARLKMDCWISVQTEEPTHFCNTAACVCGYQAISGIYGNFNVPNRYEDKVDIAIIISEEFTAAEPYSNLGQSVYEMSSGERYLSASKTGIFTDKELDSFDYLNYDNITPENVIEYLEAVVKRVQELEK
jgi:hypothetical protein